MGVNFWLKFFSQLNYFRWKFKKDKTSPGLVKAFSEYREWIIFSGKVFINSNCSINLKPFLFLYILKQRFTDILKDFAPKLSPSRIQKFVSAYEKLNDYVSDLDISHVQAVIKEFSQVYLILHITKTTDYTDDLKKIMKERFTTLFPNANSRKVKEMMDVFILVAKYDFEYLTMKQMMNIVPAVGNQITEFRMSCDTD